MEASEVKKKQYEDTIKNIDRQSLVYIDESGIDMSICKDRGWGKKSEKLVGKKSGKYYEQTNIIANVGSKIKSLVLHNYMMRYNNFFNYANSTQFAIVNYI